MKTKLVPFDIELAKKGAKVITRDGRSVKRLFYDIEHKANDYPILAYVQEDGEERTLSFTELGKHVKCCKSKFDLFIEEEVEETDDYDPYKATVEFIANMVEIYSSANSDELKDFYNEVKVKCREAVEYDNTWNKKQDEKPDDNKPKFKIGDIIVNGYCMGKVAVVTDDAYLLDTGQGIPFSCDAHLWNIQDAKDGDVLACYDCIVLFKEIDGLNIKCHCAYHYMNTPMFFVDTLQNKMAFYPATKEQRELLFQKIKEEGYEWDSDKKELKKIENEENEERSARMTNRELALWLRSCPEELRECKYLPENTICYAFSYREDDADKPVEDFFAIRRNGGEWQEPLIEI